jgi:hypothetical protein
MERGGEKSFSQREKKGNKNHSAISSNSNQLSNVIIKINGHDINTSNTSKSTSNDIATTRTNATDVRVSGLRNRRINRFSNIAHDSSRDIKNVKKEKRGYRMDDRYYQRVYSNSCSSADNIPSLSSHYKDFRRIRHVFENLLKKLRIPFATVSTTFLTSRFAYANSFIENGKISNNPFYQKEGFLQAGDEYFEKINTVIDVIIEIIEWFKNFKQNFIKLSLDILSFSYETITNVVIHTPIFIFNNPYIKNSSTIFAFVSISVVILLTIYEGFMKMFRKKHNDLNTIVKRLPFAIAGAGFAPFLFETAFKFINRISKGITEISGSVLRNYQINEYFRLSEFDVLGMLAFDIVLLALLIPIFLQNGKRWWDLFCLSAITPLALSSWIFDRHRHLYNQWWNTIVRHSVVQIVYSFFIMLIGLFIMGTRYLSTDYWLFKFLIITGGLYRLANPPQIVRQFSRGEDVVDLYKDYKKTFKNTYDTLTMKRFKPSNRVLKMIKDKMKK